MMGDLAAEESEGRVFDAGVDTDPDPDNADADAGVDVDNVDVGTESGFIEFGDATFLL